jgi:transcription elongation factor GreB
VSKAFTKEDDSGDDVVVPRRAPPREPAAVDPAVAASGVIHAGAFVKLDDGTEVQVVEPEAADAAARRISVESPLGRALLGKRAGDEIVVERPRGAVEHTVLSVRY